MLEAGIFSQIFLTLVGQYFPRAEDVSESEGGEWTTDRDGSWQSSPHLVVRYSLDLPLATRPLLALSGKPDTYLLDTTSNWVVPGHFWIVSPWKSELSGPFWPSSYYGEGGGRLRALRHIVPKLSAPSHGGRR